jgi:hypothetical protein
MLLFYNKELSAKKLQADIDVLNNKNEQDTIKDQALLNVLKLTEGKFNKDSLEYKEAAAAADRIRNRMNERDNELEQSKNGLINKNAQDTIAGIAAIEKYKQEIEMRNKVSQAGIDEASLSKRETELSFALALGRITDEDAAKERASIDRARQKSVYSEAVAQNESKIKELREKQEKLDLAKTQGVDTSKDQGLLDKEIASYKLQRVAIDESNDAKLKAIGMTEILGSHFMGLEKIVGGAFLNMADALVEFAKTGKLNFKSLVDSMIADLLRYELRQQMMAMYGGMGGGGILGGLASFFGIKAGPAAGPGIMDSTATMAGMPVLTAKGRAYDMGMQKFANGGMFTNSIVTQPTLFKFAQGTGMMGEAGPEAIMPLRRDGAGNLGVINGGGHGKVDVVVNNFSSEKATTTETVDSRGNRKIEVMVGDMVADQIGRHGSSAQQALNTNYGQRPTLVRLSLIHI